MKEIIYFVQRYRPEIEANSKEVSSLFKHFKEKSHIHDLHKESMFKIRSHKRLSSYHFIYYPFAYPFIFLKSRKKIKHVFTSLLDSLYVPLLSKRDMVLTSTNYFTRDRIKKRLQYLKKVKKIIIEAEIQRKELISVGIKNEKIEVIPPPVDLNQFSFIPPKGTFKILNASCPTKLKDLNKRGILLLSNVAQRVNNTEFHLLWRDDNFIQVQRIIKGGRKDERITIRKEIVKDMNIEYGNHHCTIIPYLRFDENLKLMPNSAIESLAAGKPILVSAKTGIAPIIKKEKCGVVFDPTEHCLLEAIKEIKKNYTLYQKNCRKTAFKYFSRERFLKAYKKIYEEISKYESN